MSIVNLHIHMLQGWYYDPLHGNCLRRIRRTSARRYRITGVYGDDEPNTGGAWYALVSATPDGDDEYALEVDFVGKPIKRNRFMTARWSERQIFWDDGNVWKMLYISPLQLM